MLATVFCILVLAAMLIIGTVGALLLATLTSTAR